MVNVDHIWKTLGPLGIYQLKQFAMFYLVFPAWIFQTLNIAFIGKLRIQTFMFTAIFCQRQTSGHKVYKNGVLGV